MDHFKKYRGPKKKSILRLFPFLNDPSKADQLKIDSDSISYISLRDDAENITVIIEKHLEQLGLVPKDCIITDATAGVGGNTISFAKHFKWVYAVELNYERYSYLVNNLAVYDINNFTAMNEDCLKVLDKIDNHNIVFLDPPWGGRGYKDFKALKLLLSSTSIEMICNDLMNSVVMTHAPEIIVLKLPSNYDVRYFHKSVKSTEIYFYELEKMFIFVIINQNAKHKSIDDNEKKEGDVCDTKQTNTTLSDFLGFSQVDF
jgi:16S rRNA G966 N2-methylase RsmD